MSQIEYADKLASANILLTSAGLTTEPMQNQARAMAEKLGSLNELTILIAADGWADFAATDKVSLWQRTQQRLGSMATKAWTNAYLHHTLPGAKLAITEVGRLSAVELEQQLSTGKVMLVVPGGNTYLGIRGLRHHASMIRHYVHDEAVPYIGDSNGSILAGLSTDTASLKPADPHPNPESNELQAGLGLIDAHIIVHASGNNTNRFAVPGIASAFTSRMLVHYQTPTSLVEEYEKRQQTENITIYSLNNLQALAVSSSRVTRL